MNFIYKNLFALPNLRPYTKHKKRIIPAIITGRFSSFFLLLYYTLNSLCWLDGGPPYKNVVSKVGGPPESWGSGPPDPPVVAPLRLGNCQNSPALWVGYGSLVLVSASDRLLGLRKILC